jgi:hypothetical protein
MRRLLARPGQQKGHSNATFRSLFGDLPIRVRRLLALSLSGTDEAKSFAAFDLEARTKQRVSPPSILRPKP